MGYVNCLGPTFKPHRAQRACWRCDRCPTCDGIGRLLRGDYCAECTELIRSEGNVWSDYMQDWIAVEDAAQLPRDDGAQMTLDLGVAA